MELGEMFLTEIANIFSNIKKQYSILWDKEEIKREIRKYVEDMEG